MNFLKQNWFKIALLVLVLVAFYWYGYRLSQIKKECARISQSGSGFSRVLGLAIDEKYKNCLREKGL